MTVVKILHFIVYSTLLCIGDGYELLIREVMNVSVTQSERWCRKSTQEENHCSNKKTELCKRKLKASHGYLQDNLNVAKIIFFGSDGVQQVGSELASQEVMENYIYRTKQDM